MKVIPNKKVVPVNLPTTMDNCEDEAVGILPHLSNRVP